MLVRGITGGTPDPDSDNVKGTPEVSARTPKSDEAVAVGAVAATIRRSEKTANRLHPIQVEFSYPVGSRIDMVEKLPPSLEEEDLEEWIEKLSSPREFEERIAPVTAQFNGEEISAKNPTELRVKFCRVLARRLENVAEVLQQSNRENFGEPGQVAFMGLGLDPETITRIIELDYETADNVYSRIAKLWDAGHVAPLLTMPFHTLMPLVGNESEMRLLVRIAFELYWPLLKKYNRAVARIHNEKVFTATAWLPEGAFSAKVLQVLHEEFVKLCEEEEVGQNHLILLLDCEQSKEREYDVLMKRWNTLRPAPTTRDIVTILYKERAFSDWVLDGHPSTKKQLDRTIAKVDAVLRDANIDHQWSHFEPLMTLLSTFKACVAFEQKLIKLTELGYQPCAPDVFVRRKLLRLYGMEENEPRRTTLRDMTCWQSYPDAEASMVKFRGIEETGGLSPKPILGPERPYARRLLDATTRKARGNPCWKPALMDCLRAVQRAIIGEPRTHMGGMLGLMRSITPIERVPVMMRNIEDFLVRYARIHWKEHFIQHVYSEADIRLDEFARECLLAGATEDAELSDEHVLIAGAAAEAIYLAHQGLSSIAFSYEHIDQRATYENVTMMTLALAHAVTALRWANNKEEADRLFNVWRTELLQFDTAYTRHKIAALGVEEKSWRATIKSQVPDSDLNVVERAARRVGALHLRRLGYREHFEKKDEGLATSVGHAWSTEIDQPNLKWENELFHGLTEE